MTFRTNQPGSALEILSAFWEQSIQNLAMDLRRIQLWSEGHNSFYFCAGIWVVSPPLSIDTLDADSSGGPGFCLYQAATASTLTYYAYLRTFFSGFGGPVKKNEDPSPKNPREAAAPTSTATAWRSSSLIRTTANPNILKIEIWC